MPELPEVEVVCRGLSSLIPGRVIRSISHDNPKSFPNPESEVGRFAFGAKIMAVRRRAKVLMIDLDTAYTFVIHLKMTGQLVFVSSLPPNYQLQTPNSEAPFPISQPPAPRWGAGHPNDSLVGRLPDKSTRVTVTFDDGSHLYFNDQRKFGWMRLMPTVLVPEIDFMKKVGPEPLEDEFTGNVLFERLQRRKNTTIKAAILDQTVLAGVGNIYADEGLWGAQIHPASLVKNLQKSKIQNLASEIKFVLNLSIEKGGSTDRNYVNAEGKKGSYVEFARVFRKEGLPCPRCQTPIIKTRVASRGTHLCPVCQVLE